MRREGLHIRLQPTNKALVFLYLFREVFQQTVLQAELLAVVVCFHNFELGHLNVQIHALFDAGITGTQRLDLRKGQRCSVHILAGANRRF